MIIIDATNLILGRMATVAAKKALLGEEVRIINAGKAVVTGTKLDVVGRYITKYARGIPAKGPFFPRMPERFVKRAIRGMLPYKQSKGLAAYKRIICHKGVPKELEGKETLKMEGMSATKLATLNYGTVETVCKELGGRS